MLELAMKLINRPDRQIKLLGHNSVEKGQDIPIKLINPIVRDRVKLL